MDSNTDNTSQDAARALENQLNASLAAIHDRLNAIEARLSDNNKNETLMAIHRDLEDLRRKYQAGQYLWSDGKLYPLYLEFTFFEAIRFINDEISFLQ